jgi:hypothetical protein
MKNVIWVSSLILFLSLTGISEAQLGKAAGPKFYSDFRPIVGGWSEYQVTSKGGSPSKMKVAVVGKEGEAYWYEMVMETKREGRMISKMLVSGDPEDSQNIKRFIVKAGNEPAMEMPVQMMQASTSQGKRGEVTDKGTEMIRVPAGSFKTQHMQYQEGETVGDTWVNREVSPYGVVKSQAKDFEMVLVDYGTGAQTLIAETPKKFEMPQIPQMPQLPQLPPRKKP